jgi:hypothetical protein
MSGVLPADAISRRSPLASLTVWCWEEERWTVLIMSA